MVMHSETPMNSPDRNSKEGSKREITINNKPVMDVSTAIASQMIRRLFFPDVFMTSGF